MNFPIAIRPNAKDAALIVAFEDADGGLAEKTRNAACIVVMPYTGSMRVTKASLIVLVASRTFKVIRYTVQQMPRTLTLKWLLYRIVNSISNTSLSRPST